MASTWLLSAIETQERRGNGSSTVASNSGIRVDDDEHSQTRVDDESWTEVAREDAQMFDSKGPNRVGGTQPEESTATALLDCEHEYSLAHLCR